MLKRHIVYLLFNKQLHKPVDSQFMVYVNQMEMIHSESVKYFGVIADQWFSTLLSWRTLFGADKAVSDPPKILDKIYYFPSYSEVARLVGNAAIAPYHNADYCDYNYTHKL